MVNKSIILVKEPFSKISYADFKKIIISVLNSKDKSKYEVDSASRCGYMISFCINNISQKQTYRSPIMFAFPKDTEEYILFSEYLDKTKLTSPLYFINSTVFVSIELSDNLSKLSDSALKGVIAVDKDGQLINRESNNYTTSAIYYHICDRYNSPAQRIEKILTSKYLMNLDSFNGFVNKKIQSLNGEINGFEEVCFSNMYDDSLVYYVTPQIGSNKSLIYYFNNFYEVDDKIYSNVDINDYDVCFTNTKHVIEELSAMDKLKFIKDNKLNQKKEEVIVNDPLDVTDIIDYNNVIDSFSKGELPDDENAPWQNKLNSDEGNRMPQMNLYDSWGSNYD